MRFKRFLIFVTFCDSVWHSFYDSRMFVTLFCFYLRAAAAPHRLKPEPSRPNTAACRPPDAPCRCEFRTAAAAPDSLRDLTEWEVWVPDRSHLCGVFFHVGGSPFLAASWMGDANLKWVWTGAPCCRRSLTQAALPLLQELKRGVAPSADINATYRGRWEGKYLSLMAGQLLINFQVITLQAHHIRKKHQKLPC